MRIDRMLAITIILLNRKTVTAKQLAEKFEVSVRTIYRDIDAINEAGIPIVSYPGSGGGLGIMENYKLDRQVLSLKDMMAMLSALKGVNATFNDQRLDGAIEKITSLVPKDKSEQLEQHLEQLVFDINPWAGEKRQNLALQLVHSAVISQRLLSFVYFNMQGEKKERTVEPMTLLFKGYGWYLFGYCLLKKDFRLFRLSRMRDLVVSDNCFERRPGSWKEYASQGMANAKTTELVLRFSPEMRTMIEDSYSEEQIEYLQDGDMLVRASYPVDEWVYSMILSYGEAVEVIAPDWVRCKIITKIKKIEKKYKT